MIEQSELDTLIIIFHRLMSKPDTELEPQDKEYLGTQITKAHNTVMARWGERMEGEHGAMNQMAAAFFSVGFVAGAIVESQQGHTCLAGAESPSGLSH